MLRIVGYEQRGYEFRNRGGQTFGFSMKYDSRIDRFGIRSYYVHEITNACRFLVRHVRVAGAAQVRSLVGVAGERAGD